MPTDTRTDTDLRGIAVYFFLYGRLRQTEERIDAIMERLRKREDRTDGGA